MPGTGNVTNSLYLRASLLSLATVALVGVATTAASAKDYAETILYNFAGQSDGNFPSGGLVRDSSGNLYGTTPVSSAGSYDCGAIYKVSPAGALTSLHVFTGGNDGCNSQAGLTLVGHDLYGTTEWGGAFGQGVVFKLNIDSGKFKAIHEMNWPDGSTPLAPLISDRSGNLYGTAWNGGDLNCRGSGVDGGCGTVFEVSPSGDLTVLHEFGGGTDGAAPTGGLVRDAAGNLFGTTEYGGNGEGGNAGDGTVFEISASGQESILHGFTTSGQYNPWGSLALDKDGNLYGTTTYGGGTGCSGGGCGGLYEITASGSYVPLYTFQGQSDGGDPEAGVFYKSGVLYGTAYIGGVGGGTVFAYNIRKGQLNTLYQFAGSPDGNGPAYGTIIHDDSGNLYGATEFGGPNYCPIVNGQGYYCGTIFELSPTKR